MGAGSIEGFVRDSSGAVVPNAKVDVKNVNTGVSRSATTDLTGRYDFLSLPVGEYEVRANGSGFRTTVRSGITLVIGRRVYVLTAAAPRDRNDPRAGTPSVINAVNTKW